LATLVASEDRRLYLEFLPVDGASDSDPRRLNRCEELLARMRSSQLEKFDEAVTAKN
jgi:hypothetical protein